MRYEVKEVPTTKERRALPAHIKAVPGMPISQISGSDSYVGVCQSHTTGNRAVFTVGKKDIIVSLRKDGYYREVGKETTSGHYFVLGIAETEMDPSF